MKKNLVVIGYGGQGAWHCKQALCSDVHDYYRNFVAALDGKEDSLIKHSEVRRVMKVMEAAFESDRTGAPVKFDEAN